MELTGMMGGLYRLTEWISRLALLNILWILGILSGFVLFGFFPATIAMFSVVRKWAMHELDVPIGETFFRAYKKEFLKGNRLGLIVIIASTILYIDFRFLQGSESPTLNLLIIPFWILTFIFIGVLGYVFPVYVHYKMKLGEVFRSSFFLLFMNPLSTLIMFVGSFGLLFLLQFSPPLAIICSGNLIALTLTKPAHTAFEKLSNRANNDNI